MRPDRARVRVAALGLLFALFAPYHSLEVEAATIAGELETLVLPSRAEDGVVSETILEPDEMYIFVVSGTFSYGFLGGKADAECSNVDNDPTWQRERYRLLDPDNDLLDVYVNDQPVDWRADKPDSLGCDSRDHRYQLTFHPETAGRVKFSVHDLGHSNNRGALTIRIFLAQEKLIETVAVSARAGKGVASTRILDPSKRYRIESEGFYGYGFLGGTADAECSTIAGDPTWQRDRYAAIRPQGDLLDLLVNGTPVNWRPTKPDPLDCNTTDHVYELLFQPQVPMTLTFKVDDTSFGDNAGALTVRIFELFFTPPPPRSATDVLPRIELVDRVEVDGGSPHGASTKVPLAEGKSYLLEASGIWGYGAGFADARCSTTSTSVTFAPSDVNYPPPTFPEGIIQLLVNDGTVPWVPTEPDVLEPLCNSTTHSYRQIFVPARSGPANFRLRDSFFRDNTGSLTVQVFLVQEIPLGTIPVDSGLPTGAPTPPLQVSRTYRLQATGDYSYWDARAGTQADAECTQAAWPPHNDPTFKPHRFLVGERDLLDLVVGGDHVEWAPLDGSLTGCDESHSYELAHSPKADGPVFLKIDDKDHRDNAGILFVDLFLRAS